MSTTLPIREIDDRDDLSTALDGPATLSTPHGDYLAYVVDGATRWLVVDHRCTFIGDDDAEAMYETNLAAARDALGVDEFCTVTIGRSRYYVAPMVGEYDDDDGPTAIMSALCASLADCPLLDEEDYYRREYDAWMVAWRDWASAEVAHAVAGELGKYGADGDAAVDLASGIESATFDRWAHDGMNDYPRGFTGEYDQAGAVAGVIAGLWATACAIETLAAAGILAGIVPLPFPR